MHQVSSNRAAIPARTRPVARLPRSTFLLATALGSATVVVPSPATQARAAEANADAEQVIVTGTRDPHQTARKSVSPVVVISARQLSQTGQADVRDALIQMIPSMTRSNMNIGNSNMTDAIQLRGLTPNQTLVLVNGKRRHTTSVMTDYTGPQQGSIPVDIDMIPVSAIDHVEVLQDGAAAQYGSDAIAGVVNIILKQSSRALTAQAINGGYYYGDGFTSGESVNWGTDLGGRGFFDLSAEYKYMDHTDRGGPDNRTGLYDNHILGNPRQQRETISYNMGYDVTENIQLYSFASYGHVNGESYQNFRTSAILPEVYPNGFSPQITLAQNDYSFTGGFKGHHLGWDWDVSTTYGGNAADVGMFDTVNPDLYQATGATPTTFDPMMTFNDTEWTTDAGIRRGFHLPVLASPLNFALGAQYRYDTYQVGAGEPASYYGGGPAADDGLSPMSASNSHRDVTAGYLDLSTQLIRNLQLDLAGRIEHYTDVGNTETGKAALRYDINPVIGLRGTISNGFRAPSLAEEHYSNLGVSPTGASGILPVNSRSAILLGSRPLRPERSMNYSVGLVLNPAPRLHIAIDAYQIDMRHRITLGGVYNGEQAIDALEAGGFGLPSGLIPADVTAQYFANTSNTRTRGADITATYQTPLGRYGSINWDVAVNVNETQITHIDDDQNGNPLLNALYQGFMTSYTPRNKQIFGGTWSNGKWSVALHEIRYGHVVSQQQYVTGPYAYSNSVYLPFYQAPRAATNILVGYQVTPSWRVALGANNLFNARQRTVPYDTNYLGTQKFNFDVQQIGFNGGYYYFQINYSML
ncbi:TonB-dependent receptor plug domain-containing protein [Gluconacetobacter tumulisoli]|uniref:TonB-dependent receptor n=1 Tax=Gluconacetobacter tumulisoli TaxID=1286189 RepID=A0A7W4PLF1_9PROT|nr:TonB-dependent receptor [Gluconacetobacter tumulisoli]MBB2202075.1 TonB-dependent receptor [Gluconacetobacter tumulisoli]